MKPLRIPELDAYFGKWSDGGIEPGFEEDPNKSQFLVVVCPTNVLNSYSDCFEFWDGLTDTKLKPEVLWRGGMMKRVVHEVFFVSDDHNSDEIYIMYYVMNCRDQVTLLGKLRHDSELYSATRKAFDKCVTQVAKSPA